MYSSKSLSQIRMNYTSSLSLSLLTALQCVKLKQTRLKRSSNLN